MRQPRLTYMRGLRTNVLALLWVCLFAQCVAEQNAATYDGSWWLKIGDEQRRGFVLGFRDCYYHLVNRHTRLIDEDPRLAYVPRVTKYLHDHPDGATESVEALLSRVSSPPYSRPVHHPATGNESSEETKQKWGPYDSGDEWRASTELERLGMIQGFWECYERHTNSERGTFSQPRERYVQKISEWYGVNPDDPSEVDPRTVNDKIPEVLFRLHDQNER